MNYDYLYIFREFTKNASDELSIKGLPKIVQNKKKNNNIFS
jgi:hypothetical protein